MIGRTAICIPHRLSTGLTQRCEGTERSCILRAFVSLHVPTKQLSEFRQSINLSVRRLLLLVLLLLLFSRAELSSIEWRGLWNDKHQSHD